MGLYDGLLIGKLTLEIELGFEFSFSVSCLATHLIFALICASVFHDFPK